MKGESGEDEEKNEEAEQERKDRGEKRKRREEGKSKWGKARLHNMGMDHRTKVMEQFQMEISSQIMALFLVSKR